MQLRLTPLADSPAKYHIWFWSHPQAVRFTGAGLLDFRYWSENGPRRPLCSRADVYPYRLGTSSSVGVSSTSPDTGRAE